jgi:hypothetical protein
VLKDELRDLLRELCAATSAAAVAIEAAEEATEGEGAAVQPALVRLTAAVGGGSQLVAWYAGAEVPPDPNGRAAAVERTARAIRACARRWDVTELVPQSFPERGRSGPIRAHERTRAYLTALVTSLGMTAAVVTRRASILVSAGVLGELERERVPFTVRRVQVEADRQRGKTSHAEMTGDDFYAVSFWYDACLVCFFDAPYSLDFVRYRARQVTRELSQLLAVLDDPDLDPVLIAPPPTE